MLLIAHYLAIEAPSNCSRITLTSSYSASEGIRSMNGPLISVCMPAYNGESYIAEAIDSVLSQSHRNFELIITDDSSNDGTVEIIRAYLDRDPRVKLICNDVRLGPVKNHNFSVTSSTGKFIKLLAQDDLLTPTCLEECLVELEKDDNLSFVTVAKDWIDASGDLIKNESEVKKDYVQFFESDTRLVYQQTLYSVLGTMTNWVGAPSTLMMRREYFGGGFNTKFNHLMDIEFFLRLLRRSYGLYLAHRLCKFRKHSGTQSASNSISPEAFFEWIRMALNHNDTLSSSNYSFPNFCTDFITQLATHTSVSPVLRESFSKYCSETKEDLNESHVGTTLLISGVLALSRLMQQYSVQRHGGDLANSEAWREQKKHYKSEIESLRQALELRRAFDQLDDLHHTKSRIQKELIAETAARVKANHELDSLRKQISEVEAQLREERRIQSELRARIEAMGNSRSWKLTAPLRFINQLSFAAGSSAPKTGAIQDGK